MAIGIVPLEGGFGVEITGIDLAHVDDATFAETKRTWLANGIVLFRDQSLDDAGLTAFSRRFGALEPNPASDSQTAGAGPISYVWVISNVVENGQPIGNLGAGEAEWHTDMSYLDNPPMASVLYALEVPPSGGNTWFLDMTAAFRSLPQDLQDEVDGRRANHSSSLTSVGTLRQGARAPSDPMSEPGARHPIVRTHPETGQKALYLGRRRWAYVEGLALADSEALLDRLWAHCTQPRFMTEHIWRAGDVIMWDNRSVMHRRDAFDAGARRIMHRTQIAGDLPA